MKKNKGGRPLKYEKELSAQITVSFRVASDLKARLERAAYKNNRSLSEEVYQRLIISLEEKNMLHEIDAVFARYR